MLPTLRHLHFRSYLRYGSPIGNAVEMLVVAADAFPCATRLSFRNIAVLPSTFPQGAAPRLKHLEFGFPDSWITRGDIDLCMGHLPFLETVTADIWLGEHDYSKTNEADAALRAAASAHPNRPDLIFRQCSVCGIERETLKGRMR